MKFLTRTMTILVVIHLILGGLASAQEGKTYTISGSATLPDVIMEGLLGNPVTDASGYYAVTIPSGWSGTVAPMKEGYKFSPASKKYTKIEQDRMNENYTAMLIQYSISGSVGGLSSVMMKGLPGNPVTDENGYYQTKVDYGWNGTVTPIKDGYNFMPRNKRYLTLRGDVTNENYTAKRISLSISGSVATEGVIMKGLPGLPITDKEGKYRATVDYGWSGTVRPTKASYVFEPPSLSYSRVIDDQQNQDYWPTQIGPAAMLARSGGRKALVIPVDEINTEDLAEIKADMQVMSHILDKQFKQTRRTQGIFTDFGPFFGRDNRQTEATYLQGYGILFSMEVNFTFSPPTEPAAPGGEETTEPVDSTWLQARQEVFQPGAPQRSGMSEPTEERGHMMVEELKKELIGTLKHAANIRALQPDEWIILTIIGDSGGYGSGMGGMMGGNFGGGMMGGYSGGSGSAGGGAYGAGFGSGMAMGGTGSMDGRMSGMRMGGSMGMGGMGMGGFGGMGASSATVLTIRAKKSDVDAFAKGELNFEQFQEKVKTVMY